MNPASFPIPILVKSGGFSTQLAKYLGEDVNNDPLWGSRCDGVCEKGILQTHMDFLESGADIIQSNTYQASVEGFMEFMGLSHDEALEHMRKSVRLAKQARKEFLDNRQKQNFPQHDSLPLIVASIGPYGAYLHDGSEYNGNYCERISKEELQKWHKPRIESCLKEGVDGLAIETIPCQKEAEALVELLIKEYSGTKFWISFQCKDETSLANGDSFANAAYTIWNLVKTENALSNLYGIGLNCCNPKIVTPLLKSLKAQSDFNANLIVYSNSGEVWNGERKEWMIPEEGLKPLESYIPEWLSLGVKIVGGCCRVYPENISKIKEATQKYAMQQGN